MSEAGRILLRASEIIASGWCRKSSAQNEFGSPVVCSASIPPNIQPNERAGAPASFDIYGAIFRAVARPPIGKKGQEGRLAYLSIPPKSKKAFYEALDWFCKTAGVVHHAEWNDRACENSEHASLMLRTAANNAMANLPKGNE